MKPAPSSRSRTALLPGSPCEEILVTVGASGQAFNDRPQFVTKHKGWRYVNILKQIGKGTQSWCSPEALALTGFVTKSFNRLDQRFGHCSRSKTTSNCNKFGPKPSPIGHFEQLERSEGHTAASREISLYARIDAVILVLNCNELATKCSNDTGLNGMAGGDFVTKESAGILLPNVCSRYVFSWKMATSTTHPVLRRPAVETQIVDNHQIVASKTAKENRENKIRDKYDNKCYQQIE